jgi:Tfp pilus assembly protein PilV
VRSIDPDKRSCRARLQARLAAACAAGRSRLRAEGGAALIEVMVGAVVLAIATVGLLNGIDGAQGTGAKNKARSVAAALAEQDQERMRSMPVTTLAGYTETRPVVVRGVTYSVTSTATWTVDTGGPISCSSASRTAANIRIVSAVTSPATRGTVDQASLVTPPPGTYATGQGRAIVKVMARDQMPPVQPLTATLTGPANVTATTNSLGCAVFPFIPIGTYSASVSGGGYVDWEGAPAPTKPLTVTQSASTAVSFEMDRAAEIRATFDTVVNGVTANAESRWLTVSNSKLLLASKLFTAPTTAPDAEPQVNATSLFPFMDGYSVYPGQCPANAAGAKPYNPTPGQILTVASPNKLRLPSINIHVVDSAATGNVNGATVMVEPADSCANVFPTQTSTTTTAGGVAALPAPGFPYGTYKLCAQLGGNHGHADERTGSGSGSYAGSVHVDDTITNTTAAGNNINSGSSGAIRIRLNQPGNCHGFPQNGFP